MLILLALLPPLGFMGVAVWRAGQADRTNAANQFLANADNLANMFGSALDANVGLVLEVARTSPTVSLGEENARLSLIRRLFSAELYSTPHWDNFPPVPDSPGTWTLSNLFNVRPGESASLALTANLGGASTGPRTLSLVMDPRSLSHALRFDTTLFSDVLVAVVDGNGRIVARSQDEQRYIGAAVPTWSALKAVGSDAGIFNAELLEGDDVTFAFSTIPGTPGWVVVVGTPQAMFDMRWREPLMFLVTGSIVAIMAAILLATGIAAWISRPITDLVSFAAASHDIDSAASPPPPSPIVEFEALRDSFATAQRELLMRAATERNAAERLALSERRYRAIAEIGAVVTWRRDIDGGIIDVEGWEVLTGQPTAEALGFGWTVKIHPEDIATLEGEWNRLKRGRDAIELECRVLYANGAWRWMRVYGARVTDREDANIEWVGTLSDINEQKERQLMVNHLAYHDALTGLPNRSVLRERIEQCILAASEGTHSALIYVDLDRFKQANDLFGHATGDAVLCMVGERLRALLRPNDVASRVGGDEFVVLLHDVDRATAGTIARRLVSAMGRPFQVDGNKVDIGASAGIVLVTPGVTANVDELIQMADVALYEAKSTGRNRLVFFGATPALRQTG